jgi:NAD(P)-dependent dehydrogenase (short-subunit alcohol dehydrogenase family)
MAKMAPLLEIDPATWQSFFDLHLTASFRCSQAAARALVEQNEGGAIVNIGSVRLDGDVRNGRLRRGQGRGGGLFPGSGC